MVLFALALLTELTAVDPMFIGDDLWSVSCIDGHCFFVDVAGNLFQTVGAQGQPRRLSRHQFSKLQFDSLLRGFGLDRRGALWLTRDGGRTFSPTNLCPEVLDFTLAGTDVIAVCRARGLIRRSARATEQIVERPNLRAVAHGYAVTAQGKRPMLAALDGERALLAFDQGDREARAVDLPFPAVGLAFASSGGLVAAGCQGKVAVACDGRTIRPLALEPASGASSLCLRPIGEAPDGRVLLAGLPGNLFLVDPCEPRLELQPAPASQVIESPRQWRGASRIGDATLLVGDAGARGILRAGRFEPLSQERAPIAVLRAAGPKTALLGSLDGHLALTDDGVALRPFGLIPGPLLQAVAIEGGGAFALVGFNEVVFAPAGDTLRSLGTWPDLALRDLDFVDAKNGMAVGVSGALLHTIDGGKSFTLAKLDTSDDLHAIQLFDQRRAIAVGDKQLVFRTDDGGSTWQRLMSGTFGLRTLCFLDPDTGFVAGEAGWVFATIDGGKTFEPRRIDTPEPIRALGFLDNNRGLAGTVEGLVWRTQDGGRNWQRIPLETAVGITRIACLRGRGRCLVGGERGFLLAGF